MRGLLPHFVLWILYIAYLLLRRLIENPERRAVVSSVFGVFAFLDVPLVYFSIWWWRTQHPPPLIFKPGGLSPEMLKVFMFSMAALSALMVIMIWQRYKLESLRHTVEELKIEAEYQKRRRRKVNHFGSVVAAYMFIWGILMVYQFTVSRRVSNLRQEVERLKETLDRGKTKLARKGNRVSFSLSLHQIELQPSCRNASPSFVFNSADRILRMP